MTPRKPVNPDAITIKEAAALLGVGTGHVDWLRREGLLDVIPGLPSCSRRAIEALVENPWLTGAQVAAILGVVDSRVSELAKLEKIPVHYTASGRRIYRKSQIEVVANARRVQLPKPNLEERHKSCRIKHHAPGAAARCRNR